MNLTALIGLSTTSQQSLAVGTLPAGTNAMTATDSASILPIAADPADAFARQLAAIDPAATGLGAAAGAGFAQLAELAVDRPLDDADAPDLAVSGEDQDDDGAEDPEAALSWIALIAPPPLPAPVVASNAVAQSTTTPGNIAAMAQQASTSQDAPAMPGAMTTAPAGDTTFAVPEAATAPETTNTNTNTNPNPNPNQTAAETAEPQSGKPELAPNPLPRLAATAPAAAQPRDGALPAAPPTAATASAAAPASAVPASSAATAPIAATASAAVQPPSARPGRDLRAALEARGTAPDTPTAEAVTPLASGGATITNTITSNASVFDTAKPTLPPHANVAFDAHFAASVGASIARLNEGNGLIRLAVMPEHLGRIDIELDTRGTHDRIKLVAETDTVRHALAQGQARIAEELSQHGRRVGAISVELRQDNPQSGQPQSQSGADLTQQGGQRGQAQRATAEPTARAANAAAAPAAPVTINRPARGIRYA